MLAGRGVALLITGGFITTVNSPPLKFVASGYLLGLPFAFIIVGRGDRGRRARRAPHRARACSPRPSASTPRPAGSPVCGRAGSSSAPTSPARLLAGIAGIIYSSNIMAADANAAGELIELYAILAVVLGGTSLLGGKFSIAGTVIGVLIIQTLNSTILFLGVPSAESPVFFAVVVIIVVLIQSPRVHRAAQSPRSGATRGGGPTPRSRGGEGRSMTSVAATTAGLGDVRQPLRTFLSRHASLMPTFAALAILIVLLVGAQLYFGNFLTPRNMSALLLDNAFLLILAVGMTFVIVTGGIDLSVGSVHGAHRDPVRQAARATASRRTWSSRSRSSSGAAIGLVIGVLVQYFDVQPFIASLAGLFLARGLAFVVSLKSIRVEHSGVLWLAVHPLPASAELVHHADRDHRAPGRGGRRAS